MHRPRGCARSRRSRSCMPSCQGAALVRPVPFDPLREADRWDRGLRGGCVRRTVVASRRLVTVNESVDEALYACPARRGVRPRSHAKDRDRTWGHRGHLLHRAGGGGAAHDRLLGSVFLCRRLGRTQPRGRAAGSLRAGADRGRLDRRLPMATTFEPIERAKGVGPPRLQGRIKNSVERRLQRRVSVPAPPDLLIRPQRSLCVDLTNGRRRPHALASSRDTGRTGSPRRTAIRRSSVATAFSDCGAGSDRS